MKKITALIMTFVIVFMISSCGNKSFKNSKEDTVDYAKQNIGELKKTVDDIIEMQTSNNVSYGEFDYISYKKYPEYDFIQFIYDAQGMLGVQYWGIYYSSDNKAHGENGQNIELSEYGDGLAWIEQDGNNAYYTERIEGNWFFWYTDYDSRMFPDK